MLEEKKKYPAESAGIQTRNLSITSPAMLPAKLSWLLALEGPPPPPSAETPEVSKLHSFIPLKYVLLPTDAFCVRY